MAATTHDRSSTLFGTTPLTSQVRGSCQYAYTPDGLRNFDTFLADAFPHGEFTTDGFGWDNWCDIRNTYFGIDMMRRAPPLRWEHLHPAIASEFHDKNLKPTINLGRVRCIATSPRGGNADGGATEHIILSEQGMPVRMEFTAAAREEFLCQTAASAHMPTVPTCATPLVAVVEDTFNRTQYIPPQKDSCYPDEIRMHVAMMVSEQEEDAKFGNRFNGFAHRLPGGKTTTSRLHPRQIKEPVDLQGTAVDALLDYLDLNDKSCPDADPTKESAVAPPWLDLHGDISRFTPASSWPGFYDATRPQQPPPTLPHDQDDSDDDDSPTDRPPQPQPPAVAAAPADEPDAYQAPNGPAPLSMDGDMDTDSDGAGVVDATAIGAYLPPHYDNGVNLPQHRVRQRLQFDTDAEEDDDEEMQDTSQPVQKPEAVPPREPSVEPLFEPSKPPTPPKPAVDPAPTADEVQEMMQAKLTLQGSPRRNCNRPPKTVSESQPPPASAESATPSPIPGDEPENDPPPDSQPTPTQNPLSLYKMPRRSKRLQKQALSPAAKNLADK